MGMSPGTHEFGRREFLRLAGLGGALTWAVPAIVSIDAAPASATPAPSPEPIPCIQCEADYILCAKAADDAYLDCTKKAGSDPIELEICLFQWEMAEEACADAKRTCLNNCIE